MKSLRSRIENVEKVLRERNCGGPSFVRECSCFDSRIFDLFDNLPSIYPEPCPKCGLLMLTISINDTDGHFITRSDSCESPYKIIRELGGVHFSAGGFQSLRGYIEVTNRPVEESREKLHKAEAERKQLEVEAAELLQSIASECVLTHL